MIFPSRMTSILLASAATNNIEARIRELHEDGVDRELAFPNAVLALFHFPDKQLRERVFRIYLRRATISVNRTPEISKLAFRLAQIVVIRSDRLNGDGFFVGSRRLRVPSSPSIGIR